MANLRDDESGILLDKLEQLVRRSLSAVLANASVASTFDGEAPGKLPRQPSLRVMSLSHRYSRGGESTGLENKKGIASLYWNTSSAPGGLTFSLFFLRSRDPKPIHLLCSHARC